MALQWLSDVEPHFVASTDGKPADLLPTVKRNFNAKAAWRKAGLSVRALNRMQSLAGVVNDEAAKMRADLDAYKAESEKEQLEVRRLLPSSLAPHSHRIRTSLSHTSSKTLQSPRRTNSLLQPRLPKLPSRTNLHDFLSNRLSLMSDLSPCFANVYITIIFWYITLWHT